MGLNGKNKNHRSHKHKTSSRRQLLKDNKDYKNASEDDICAMSYIQETPEKFISCIPTSLSAFWTDITNLDKMPGDSTIDKLYNTLTINDRVIYIISTLLVIIITLLILQRMFSSPTPSSSHVHHYYPPKY